MRNRDFDLGIRYLKESFPEPWNLVIETACRENLCNQPRRSAFIAYAKPHVYGPYETTICEGKFKQIVFEAMLKDGACSAPTLSHMPIYTGKIETLLPLQDKIVKLVNDAEFVIYNVTLPEHVLFPGFVKLAVYEKNEKTFVAFWGEGIGNWGRLNTFLGPLIFKRIVKRYLIPKVQEELRLSILQ